MPTEPVQRTVVPKLKLTGDALISFISGAQTNIGRATFYNMKEEQRQALTDQHVPILKEARPFYTLMSLPAGVNDMNKQFIAFNLIKETIREEGLKSHEHSPATKWENEIILQTLGNVPVTRVLDFVDNLIQNKIAKKRAVYLVREWLMRNKKSWPLWAIKYRKQMKRTLKYVFRYIRESKKDKELENIYQYLAFDKTSGKKKDRYSILTGSTNSHLPQLIRDYEEVRKGNKDKLAKLPSSVAEGFMKKFNLSTEEFWKLFTDKGGQFTAKEKRTKDQSVKAAGASTELDIRKLKLFDLLVYLKSLSRLPMARAKVEELLHAKAKEVAKNFMFHMKDVGLILDNSLSMAGTKDQPFHPMLRGMAISLVLEEVSEGFKVYRTNGGDELFPKLGNQSNYADAILQALKDGCKTIIIVGDGYENAPFEGAVNQLLFTFKKKIDTKNKVNILHFNPVFASEALDVRALSDLAPQIGVRDISGMNESMFLAVAKQKPHLAIEGYIKHLISLQNDKAKELMPQAVKELLGKKSVLGIS